MLERFTREARQVVVLAQDESRELHHGYIGTEHLLLGLLRQPPTPTTQVLSQVGLTYRAAVESTVEYLGASELDVDALHILGIDLHTVRRKVEANFGPGALDMPSRNMRGCRRWGNSHIPFTHRAKKALNLSLREALSLTHNYIADGHLLLGLLREGNGVAIKVLHIHGIDPDTLCLKIIDSVGAENGQVST